MKEIAKCMFFTLLLIVSLSVMILAWKKCCYGPFAKNFHVQVAFKFQIQFKFFLPLIFDYFWGVKHISRGIVQVEPTLFFFAWSFCFGNGFVQYQSIFLETFSDINILKKCIYIIAMTCPFRNLQNVWHKKIEIQTVKRKVKPRYWYLF